MPCVLLTRSKVKPIPDFAINLTGINIMRPSKGIAGVQQIARVSDVDGICGNGQLFPKRFADRQIESRMRRQMGRAVAIQKAGTKLIGRRDPSMPWQSQREDRS